MHVVPRKHAFNIFIPDSQATWENISSLNICQHIYCQHILSIYASMSTQNIVHGLNAYNSKMYSVVYNYKNNYNDRDIYKTLFIINKI